MDNYKNGQIPTKTVDATVDITSNGQPQEGDGWMGQVSTNPI